MYLYALAAGGTAGVERAMTLIRDEIQRGLRLMGCRSIANLNRSMLSEQR
jgi:L-lactate dehydrogenase (cytochrome)